MSRLGLRGSSKHGNVAKKEPRLLIHPKYLASAAAFMTAAISGPSAAHTLDEFEGVQWGMSMQHVQSAFGNRLIPFSPPGSDALPPKFGFPHYDVKGCDFDVDFKFEKESLIRIDLVLISDSLDAAECPTKIAEILTARYGVPVIDESSREMHSQNHKRAWINKETEITEFSFFFEALNRTILNIIYEPAHIPG